MNQVRKDGRIERKEKRRKENLKDGNKKEGRKESMKDGRKA